MDLPFKEVILRKFIFKPKKILCAFFSVILFPFQSKYTALGLPWKSNFLQFGIKI